MELHGARNRNGVHDTAISAFRLSRLLTPSDCVAVVYEPSFCIIVQGAKERLLANAVLRASVRGFASAVRNEGSGATKDPGGSK
jgi:hypothetical protein